MSARPRPGLAAAAEALTALTLMAWVGGHAALGAYAARIAFRDLPRPLASSTMTAVFRSFDGLITVGLILLVAFTTLRLVAVGLATRPDRVATFAAFALVALGAFEVLYVHPQIQAMFEAGRTLEPAFDSLHRLSARAANLEIVLSSIILFAHAWSRRPVSSR